MAQEQFPILQTEDECTINNLRATVQEQAAEIERLKVEADPDALHIAFLHGRAELKRQLTAEQHKVKVLTDALRWAAERIDPIETEEYEKDDDCHCPVCNALGPVKG